MPTSAREGRDHFTNLLPTLNPFTVVDFGPGEGTYSILGRHLTPNAHWMAVEKFEPYVERYDLDQKYDTIMIGDMRDLVLEKYDVGIFGDVLEHLHENDAEQVIHQNAEWASYLYISTPIVPAPQGPSHGNDAEAHLHDWTFERMTDLLNELGVVHAWRGAIVGRWWVDLTFPHYNEENT